MHALLLSGSLGMGHDVMAEACATSLEQRDWTTDTADSLRLMGSRSGKAGERVFRGLLAIPGVYDAFHYTQLRSGGRLAALAERASSKYVVPALDAELRRRPSDLLISVFATGAAAASRIKPHHPDLKTVVFCTDLCPHRLWVHENTDLYLVTSQTSHRFVRRFHPDANVVVVPAPARPPFYTALTQPEARDRLGIPPGEPCVLLMSGSWGVGPVVQQASAIAASGVHVLAVAGRNTALHAALTAAAQGHPYLTPFGFTDQIPTLMAAADLVITSSGDTCAEARIVGRHLLLLDVVPGHGRENLQQELARGHADVAPTEPDGLRRATLACLDRMPHIGTPTAGTRQAWEQAFGKALASLGFAEPRVPILKE